MLKDDHSDSSTLFVPSEAGDGQGGGFCWKSPEEEIAPSNLIRRKRRRKKGEENNEEPFLPNVSSVGLFSDPILSPQQPSRRESV